MPLNSVRDQFIRATGRFDLATIGGPDSGANFFLNAGQRFLDSYGYNPKSIARFQKDLLAGQFTLQLTGCRSVKSVWVIMQDGRKRAIKPFDLDSLPAHEILRRVFSKTFSQQERGEPVFYAVNVSELSPQQANLTALNYNTQFTYEFEDITFGDHHLSKSILLLPPADQTYTIVVFGHFFATELVVDTDKNYWTEQYPELLVFAAAYKLEAFYRNTEGAKDWLSHIQLALDGIDHDIVEEEISDADALEG